MTELDGEQLQVQALARELAETRIGASRAAEIDDQDEFPWDVLAAFKETGLIGVSIPEQFGGAGASLVTSCLVCEEIARVSLACSLIVSDQKLAAEPIVLAGSPEQQARFLPAIAGGEQLVAFALTEPSAGSDIASMATRASRSGDGWVINGRKCFITNGSVANLFTLFAATAHSGRHRISAFIVPRNTPGVSIGRIEKKMGIHGSPTAEIIFEDVQVPGAALLGEEGHGQALALAALDPARVTVGAQAVGLAQGALDVARAYAKERIQFGQPIASFQGIQFMLADMATQIEAARQLTYRAARAYDDKDPEASNLSAMAKLFASDMAMRVTTDAVQVLGGYGYIREYGVERMMRDAKILQIFDGTNQIQRLVIARHILQ
jgi:alkylation response protein AidB-like acyl-CoA dehydrogenase